MFFFTFNTSYLYLVNKMVELFFLFFNKTLQMRFCIYSMNDISLYKENLTLILNTKNKKK
ncbi:hypothetical protein C4F50_17205 [Flavobacterium sp. KB82]|uniref:Uncharacterized protein n=1 Tax=Flavobacterium hungaricum TaxID=2082725 RepID=A0ABR9TMR3_9FLAO|nr:hypothetical protein [Flavobacterium hungaricum]